MSANGNIRLLSLSAWGGLFAGLGEIICLAAQKWIFHKALFLGPHTIWMAPLATICIFLLIGLALLALARWRPRFGSPKFIGGVLFFFAFLGWLLIFPRLQPHASLLLAAGLAVQGARLAVKYPRFFAFLSMLRLRWATAIVLVLTLGVYGWESFRESRARGVSAV